MATKLKLTAYHNLDDVQLFWRAGFNDKWDKPIPGCLGFCIERQRQNKDGVFEEKIEILRNRVGFLVNAPVEGEEDEFEYVSQPCNIWPFQTYNWTDHGANNGQTVRYRISAMKKFQRGKLGETKLDVIATSDWTDSIEVTDDCGEGFSAYFNRGFVMSQYVSRIARQNDWSPGDIKKNIKMLKEPLRRFMAGELRVALLKLLDDAIENPQLDIYAALFELTDEELIDRLVLLRHRAHVILANGAGEGDHNEEARKKLKKNDVDVRDRLLASKRLGHNKFVVVYQTQMQKATKVWTGSTNWAPTGLCTQANNGILISNQKIATLYSEYWDRLAEAGSSFTNSLIEQNALSPRIKDNVDVWFTPVRKRSTKNKDLGIDLNELIRLVKSAKEAVLYVMFQPGSEPLQTIMSMENKVLVKGTVSTLIASNVEKFTIHGIEKKDYEEKLVVPDGIKMSFSFWLSEVTRGQFMGGIGHAITHSKMIVIDPLSDDCKVITGSHNFSSAASEMNDENFVVVHGNKKLAEAYAVACLGTYSHYRWRAHVKDKQAAGEEVWSHLSDVDSWQKDCLTDEVKETLRFWTK
jgi:hypothetical protein